MLKRRSCSIRKKKEINVCDQGMVCSPVLTNGFYSGIFIYKYSIFLLSRKLTMQQGDHRGHQGLPDLLALPVGTAYQARPDKRAQKATSDHKALADHQVPKDQLAL